LGSPCPPHRVSESSFKVGEVFRCAVGESVVSLIPDLFGGVEFRGIGRKLFDRESGMVKEKLLDFFPPMDSSSIPQQDHRTVKMPEQGFEEGSDIPAGEIPGARLDIEGQPPPLGGHGKGTEGRNSVLLVEPAGRDGKGRAFALSEPRCG
jgi:hypothetical protein